VRIIRRGKRIDDLPSAQTGDLVLKQVDQPPRVPCPVVVGGEVVGHAASAIATYSNARRIGVTEPYAPDQQGASDAALPSEVYLFNHFTAEDSEEAIAGWERLTSWYVAKTGVDNSTLLQSVRDARYDLINYVRLPSSPPRFLFDQLRRPSFATFVRATLREHRMRAFPIFFKPA
jgi:hypothetical protein